MPESNGRGQARVSLAGDSDRFEYVEDWKLGVIDNDFDYEAIKFTLSCGSSSLSSSLCLSSGLIDSGRRRLLPSDLTSSDHVDDHGCHEIVTSQSDLPEKISNSRVLGPAPINDKSCSFLQGHRAVDNNTSSANIVTSEIENPVTDEESMNAAKLYLESEDLARKPLDWGGYMSSHIGRGCVGSVPTKSLPISGS